MKQVSTRFIELKAENIGIVKYVALPFGQRDVIEIKGKNGAGKTTVLHLADMLLYTDKVKEMPIREGKTSGEIVAKAIATVDGKEYNIEVKRKFTEKNVKGYLSITPKVIGDLSTPTQIIDGLFGSVSLNADPLGFAKLPGKEQVAILVNAIGGTADEKKLRKLVNEATGHPDYKPGTSSFDVIQHARTAIYDHRRDNDRDAKKLEAVINELPIVKVESVKIGDLQKRREEAVEFQSQEQAVGRLKTQLEEMEEQRKALDGRIATMKELVKSKSGEIEKFPAVESIASIDEKIKSASDINLAAAKYDERITKEAELEAFNATGALCTKNIALIDEYMTQVLDVSKLGIEGLELREDGVYVNAVMASELSSTERAILGLRISYALNSKLKLIKVDDWERYDSDKRKAVIEFATEHGLDVLVATVDESGEEGIIIEDGVAQSRYPAK